MTTNSYDNLSAVRHVILVMSGKGGVGKSTVASQIACGLRNSGKKVGLLDVDLCGPSMPKMFNIEENDVHQCSQGNHELPHLSLAPPKFQTLDLSRPCVTIAAMIKQFLSDVYWQDIDYLIIDTPPGTSDEHITVVESLRTYNPDGAILVTTPQAVAVNDVRREITFCKKSHIPVIGLIENMSGYVCPNCSECSNIFSKGGGESLAQQYNVPFLGCIPLDPQLTRCSEEGRNFVDEYQQSATLLAINDLIEKLIVVDKNLP